MGGCYYPNVPWNRFFSNYSYLKLVLFDFGCSGWLKQHFGKEADMSVCVCVSFCTMKETFKMMGRICLLNL